MNAIYQRLRHVYDLLEVFVRTYPGTRKRDDRHDSAWQQLVEQIRSEMAAVDRLVDRARNPRLRAWVNRFVTVLDRYPIYLSWRIPTPYRAKAQRFCIEQVLPALRQVLRALGTGSGLGAAAELPAFTKVLDPKDKVSATRLGAGVQYMPGARIDSPGLVVVVEPSTAAAAENGSGKNQWWKAAVASGLTQFLSIAVLALAGRAWAKANLPALEKAPTK